MFNLNIASVLDLCSDAAVKKELEKLAENFRFSDPVSSESTEEIENIIMEKLEKLKIQITSSSSDENIEKITELNNVGSLFFSYLDSLSVNFNFPVSSAVNVRYKVINLVKEAG